MSIIYGTLYMLFGAFPIVYQQVRGWSQGIGGLPFLGVAIGMMIAVTYTIVIDNKRYLKVLNKNGGFAPPEARLPPCQMAAVILPIGLAWFAWTNYPSFPWAASVASSVFFGFGLVLIFLGVMNYLIDAYTIFAASVLAANGVIRSIFGAVFPLFTTQMYHGIGIHWATMVPCFLALACLPFPFFFYRYGAKIRARCKYAAEADAFIKKLRGQLPSDPTESDEEREAEVEQDAADYSYEDESKLARFEKIKAPDDEPSQLTRQTSRSSKLAPPQDYENSPFDLDRVNTRDSFRTPKSKRDGDLHRVSSRNTQS
jgi:hypothetical protein